MMAGVSGWFSIKVDILAILLMLIIAVACIFARSSADPIILSMLLSYLMSIQDNLA
jgi:uncharacterized MnhB-related membrane protein